ncbi:MAG: sigma 54-interacting transcriptional regulator [Desulfobacterales bacterium]
MIAGENEFFRKAAIRICGSLDIADALWGCMQVLSDFVPGEELYLHLYDSGLGAMHTIAGATAAEGRHMDSITPLPREFRNKLESERPGPRIVNEPRSEPAFQFMLNYHGRPDTSALVRVLMVEGGRIGVLALLASGRGRFSDEHARLFAMLDEPFTIALANALKHQEILRLKDLLVDDNRYLHGELLRLSGNDIVGAEFGLKTVMGMARQVAPLDSPVLLLGETGVGKDVVANAIHRLSPRKDGPFVKVNCGAIPETLVDSELFGHEKGAFTGALSQRRGRFERADRGTLFLDEIGELPPQAQVRMLRVLQHKEIERVGGANPVSVDIRLIAATNSDLEQLVAVRQFREDLWFRINVFPIRIPALRERKPDIPALVHYFVERKSRELKLAEPPALLPGAIDRLIPYHWPGNVRELENVVERALILSRGGALSFEELIPGRPAADRLPDQAARLTTIRLDAVVAGHIRAVLESTGGKVHGKDGAAALLGVNPSTLRNRMDRLGVAYGKRASPAVDSRARR